MAAGCIVNTSVFMAVTYNASGTKQKRKEKKTSEGAKKRTPEEHPKEETQNAKSALGRT